MKNMRLLVYGWVACSLLGACSHAPLSESASRTGAAISPRALRLAFIASPRCQTKPYGCTLGGQLGGIEAQRQMFEDQSKQGDLLAFWGGSIFPCAAKGKHTALAMETAKAARTLPLALLAPSGEDLAVSPAMLKRLHDTAGKPWVVSNYSGRNTQNLWVPWLDLSVADARFRVFNFVWPFQQNVRQAKHGFDPDLSHLEKLLNQTPADRVNIVIVSTSDPSWWESVTHLKKAHVVLDASSVTEQTDGPVYLPGDRIVGSVRQGAQVALVLELHPEPTFRGFYSEAVAGAEKIRRAFASGPDAAPRHAIEKEPGLWDSGGNLYFMANPEAH